MPACPDRDRLIALEGGRLSDREADELLAHIDGCSQCAASLESLRKENLDCRVIRRAVGEDVAAESITDGKPADAAREWNIPDYERVRLCGEGAFGTVWAVRDRVGVYRALKVIDLARVASAQFKCRELSALESYCRLVAPHPNLIRVSHVGISGDQLYYTMELADDGSRHRPVRDEIPHSYRPLTLRSVLGETALSVDTAIEVVLRLLRGLANLHRVGLAHRDIKPANIVFVESQPKLSDIGMITSNTATPSQVGTPEYMPPDGLMDLTADTYAMGRVLYDLLATGGDDAGFPELPPSVLNRTDSWDMDRVQAAIRKACSESAADRYADADRMCEALERCRCLSFDDLFATLDRSESQSYRDHRSEFTPIAVAAINALPWVFGLILAIVIVSKWLKPT